MFIKLGQENTGEGHDFVKHKWPASKNHPDKKGMTEYADNG